MHHIFKHQRAEIRITVNFYHSAYRHIFFILSICLVLFLFSFVEVLLVELVSTDWDFECLSADRYRLYIYT